MAFGVIIIGDDEVKNGTVVLRDMATSEQKTVKPEELISLLK